uniref:THUMP domain-containing protein n=1 Tax=Ditylenchus dipsaci TaxID=166011 RepID=A0A915DSB6_9BILA
MSHPYNRNYHQKGYGKRNTVQNATCGVFFTVDGEERRAVKEAMNILEIFSADLATGSSADPISTDHVADTIHKNDVSDELTTMCESSKGTSNTNDTRFRQLDTGVRNTMFFGSSLLSKDNIYKFVDMIVEDCQKNKRCRFLARILPVEETCTVNMDSISTSLKQIIRSHLYAFCAIHTDAPSYAVDFKQRNNDSLKRQEIIDLVTSTMAELSPDSKVNLTEADLVFGVNVVKRTTMLSCLRSYFQRNRFSIRIASEKDEKDAEVKAEDVVKDQE